MGCVWGLLPPLEGLHLDHVLLLRRDGEAARRAERAAEILRFFSELPRSLRSLSLHGPGVVFLAQSLSAAPYLFFS